MLHRFEMGSSSTNVPRAGGPSPRRIRLRADQQLTSLIKDGAPSRLEIPSRESLVQGELIELEIGFGPLADEVDLSGTVEEIRSQGEGDPPVVIIRVHREHLDRYRYVHAVIGGGRSASARAHRRIQVNMPVCWRLDGSQHFSRVHDLSRGGAFVISDEPPAVGRSIELELGNRRQALRLRGVVARVDDREGRRGFGIRFQLHDRDAVAALHQVVCEQDSSSR